MNKIAQIPLPFDPGKGEVVNDVVTIKGAERVFSNVLVSIMGFASIALFIMLIIGGIKLLTSADNPQNAEAAKKTITSAVAGIVLIAIAYLIIFLIEYFTGVDLSTFRVTI